MDKETPTVRVSQSLELAIKLMQEKGASLVGVLDDAGSLVGYLSQENIAELMMIDDAEARSGGAEAAPRPWG
jgi:stage IV sporulation protein FB